MFGLIPKDDRFFDLFRKMAQNTILGAEELKNMLDRFEDPPASQRRIKELEHKGDFMTHELIKKLNKSFITPFDREDIYSLASKMDDVMDLIDASAQRLVMYNVEKSTSEAKQLAFIILRSCQVIGKAVSLLGGKHAPIAEYCVEINALENEADRVSREAVSRLFDEEKDPIQLIKWKEIYETLEKATDRCEDVANVMESVVLKNS